MSEKAAAENIDMTDALAAAEEALGGTASGLAPASVEDDPGGGAGESGGGGGAGGGSGGGTSEALPKSRNLDLILDIPLKVTVELGRTKMIVNDLLALGQGSVIELNKLAGEPMEVLVNDKLVARGEAVVVNEKFGVRLTDIISPMERIQQLK